MADSVRWDRNQVPIIEGEVVDFGEGKSEYGTFKILNIRGTDGTLYDVAAFHTVLARQLDEARLEPGDQVRVEYLGQGTSKKGRMFHNYELTNLTRQSA